MQRKIVKTTANLFKALGNSKRLEITCFLQGHELTVNQIVQMTDLRQAAVSQHLSALKEVGLVCTKKLGKEIYYSLCLKSFGMLSDFVKIFTHSTPQDNSEPTVVDPICHMSLTPSSANYECMYDGVRHYFCGKGCLKEFSNLHKGVI